MAYMTFDDVRTKIESEDEVGYYTSMWLINTLVRLYQSNSFYSGERGHIISQRGTVDSAMAIAHEVAELSGYWADLKVGMTLGAGSVNVELRFLNKSTWKPEYRFGTSRATLQAAILSALFGVMDAMKAAGVALPGADMVREQDEQYVPSPLPKTIDSGSSLH